MLLTEHRLAVRAICPVDGSEDVYAVTIETTATIPVENILAVVDALTQGAKFQEDLTRELSLGLGARVRTIGTHSGVETTCVCEGA